MKSGNFKHMHSLRFRLPILLFVVLAILLSTRPIYGQTCDPTPCGGTCITGTFPAGTTVTWSSPYYCISSDLVVKKDAGGTPGNLTITAGVCVAISPGIKILVKDGCSLTINGAALYCSSTTALWQGIVVEGGGTVTVNNASVIADAVEGIHAQNGTVESDLEIYGGNTFCNNETGIYLDTYTGATVMNTTIKDTHFTAPALNTGSNGKYAIVVYQVGDAGNLLIGDGLYYTAVTPSYNEIDNYCIGIKAYKSYLTVENNYIHDLLATGDVGLDPPQTGIAVKGVSGTDYELIVGHDDVLPDLYNKIFNCRVGIYCKQHVNLIAYSNEIGGEVASTDATWVMEEGIHIENNCNKIEIEKNQIYNFDLYGIYESNNNGSALNRIVLNTIEETAIYTDDINPYGVFVQEDVAVVDNLLIQRNTMHDLQTCIYVQNVNEAVIEGNDLHFLQYDVMLWAYGVRLFQCEDPIVKGNFSTHDTWVPLGTPLRSFLLEDCPVAMVSENHAQYVNGGIVVKGNSSEANFWCNQLDNAWHGFHFWNVGGTPTSTPIAGTVENGLLSGYPSDNYFFPEETDYQLWINGSDLSAVDWLYMEDMSFPEYNLGIPYCWPGAGIVEPYFNDLGTGYDHCVSSPYRLGELTDEDVAMKFNSDYIDFAENYSNGLIDDAPLTWFKCYQFWKSIVSDSIQVDLLDDVVFELYNEISTTNIPEFFELSSVVAGRDYTAALEITSALAPQNEIENYWKEAVEIYITNLDTANQFILIAEIEADLWSIANLDADFYGPGVSYARAMLDTVFPVNEPEEDIRLTNPVQNIFVAPNPTTDYLIISCADPIWFENQMQIINLYDINGKLMKSFDAPDGDNTLFIGDLSNGIYFLEVILDKGSTSIKFIVLK